MQSDNFHRSKQPPSDLQFSEPTGTMPKACDALLNPGDHGTHGTNS